jgi:hypothetical protein
VRIYELRTTFRMPFSNNNYIKEATATNASSTMAVFNGREPMQVQSHRPQPNESHETKAPVKREQKKPSGSNVLTPQPPMATVIMALLATGPVAFSSKKGGLFVAGNRHFQTGRFGRLLRPRRTFRTTNFYCVSVPHNVHAQSAVVAYTTKSTTTTGLG